jgi:hypothetical protein
MALYKNIPGYNGVYLASDKGDILSLNQKYGKLKLLDNGKGYKIVYLYRNGKRQMFRVHRIIAKLFVPNPNNYTEVNHTKGIKSDNRASQLEWCTRQQNIKHALQTGLTKPICGANHHSAISVFRKSNKKVLRNNNRGVKRYRAFF